MRSSDDIMPTQRGGFTLIELLAAMAVLSVIVLLLTRVYTDGASALQLGKRSADRNVYARAVMDFIARELSMMTYDYGDDLAVNFLGGAYYNERLPVFGANSDDISFITLTKSMDGVTSSSTNGHKRSAMQIRYFVDNFEGLKDAPKNAEYRYALWRDNYHPHAASSGNRPAGAYHLLALDHLAWMGNRDDDSVAMTRRAMLIDNIRTFDVFLYTDERGATQPDWQSFNTNNSKKIAFLDLYLETMDERDASRAAQLAATLGPEHDTLIDYVNQAVKRNYRRVYLHNKMGWQDIPR